MTLTLARSISGPLFITGGSLMFTGPLSLPNRPVLPILSFNGSVNLGGDSESDLELDFFFSGNFLLLGFVFLLAFALLSFSDLMGAFSSSTLFSVPCVLFSSVFSFDLALGSSSEVLFTGSFFASLLSLLSFKVIFFFFESSFAVFGMFSVFNAGSSVLLAVSSVLLTSPESLFSC